MSWGGCLGTPEGKAAGGISVAGGGGVSEPRRIGCRRDISGGGRELRRIGCRRDMSGGGIGSPEG